MPPELSVVPDEPKICPWGTETTVIRHIRFTGEWVDIWIGTDSPIQSSDLEGGIYHYDYSSNGYMLTRAVEAAGLVERVRNRGYVGLGVVRTKQGHNFEISHVFEATP